MSTQEELKKRKSKGLMLLLLAAIAGIIAVGFIFKPLGDLFPFDDLLYKTSKKTGLKYRILKSGKGRKIKNGELAVVSFSYRKKKQKQLLYNSESSKMTWPLKFDSKAIKRNGGFLSILNEAISKLKKNGRIRLKPKASDLFILEKGKANKELEGFIKQNNLTKDSELILEINLKDRTTQKDLEEKQKKEN